jgi:sugar phosphate isomerase/epimerase
MNLSDRIGYDSGATRLEDALQAAIAHNFHYLDFNADTGPNRLGSWDDARVASIRNTCETHEIHLSLHTASAVNVAELSPFVGDAVDRYLRENVNLSQRLGCRWVVVHAGFHFSSLVQERMAAGLERLKRAAEYAGGMGESLLLENLNREPQDAEVHYLAHTVEECRFYLDAIASDRLGWAFTVNHAHLVPEGIDGFLEAFGTHRIGEVRLADNLGEKEVHLNPGQGNIDFPAVFRRLESAGFDKFYTMAFGSMQDKLAARELFTSYGFS